MKNKTLFILALISLFAIIVLSINTTKADIICIDYGGHTSADTLGVGQNGIIDECLAGSISEIVTSPTGSIGGSEYNQTKEKLTGATLFYLPQKIAIIIGIIILIIIFLIILLILVLWRLNRKKR